MKFIFATTEIRKLPVTVLSRCQRFDLRRIDPDVLTDHLASIAEKENVKIERDGLWMIARAAEGSVRDALSILDQAIVQHAAQGEDVVSAEMIRDMLGLADRSSVWALLEAAMKGDAKAALENFRSQYDSGAEPAQILRDLLDLTHLLTRIKAAGPAAASHGPAGEADAGRAKEMAAGLEMNALTRVWSLLMKGLQETQVAPDAAAAGEMALIRLCFAADLPTPDEALRALKKNNSGGQSAAHSPVNGAHGDGRPTAQVIDIQPPMSQRPAGSKIWLRAFEDVVRLAGQKRDAKLRTELESYVHLVSFKEGKIELRLHEEAPADLANRLTQRLKEWTGKAWIVSVTSEHEGEETLRDARTRAVMEHPMVKKAFELFPGAKLTTIREPDNAIAGALDDANSEELTDTDDDAADNALASGHETGKA